MNKKMKLIVLTVLVSVFFLIGNANATPGKSTCSGCHNVDPAVVVDVVFNGCSGTDADYTVTVPDTYDAPEGWAVFDGSSNIVNATGNSGSFTVAGGQSYDVWGVSDSDAGIGGGKGGSNVETITPDCGGNPVDADNDGYDETVDCNDGDPNINPGAVEDCTDLIDNDCDNLIDAQDPDAVGCPVTCTDGDGDTYNVETQNCGAVDCNDSDASINPGATEDCTDGIDNDCDNNTDCADSACTDDPACQSSGNCSDYTDNKSCNADPNCEWSGKNKVCDDLGGGGDPPPANCSDYNGDAKGCRANGCSYSKKTETCS